MVLQSCDLAVYPCAKRARTTAMKGCFCYKTVCISNDRGKGCSVCEIIVAEDPTIKLKEGASKCRCQVVFLEEHRRAIAFAVVKNNSKVMKDATSPPPGTVSSLY